MRRSGKRLGRRELKRRIRAISTVLLQLVSYHLIFITVAEIRTSTALTVHEPAVIILIHIHAAIIFFVFFVICVVGA